MLVRMRSGNIEDVIPSIARQFINLKLATEYKPKNEQAILHAEEQSGPSACIGVELAIHEPKSERAVARFMRTARSRG